MKSGHDIDLLQGRWRQISLEIDGVRKSEDEYGQNPTVTIVGNKFSVYSKVGNLVIEGTFILDPAKRPKEIDWSDSFGKDTGKTFPAIYRLSENEFTFCAGEEGGRPEKFCTRVGDTMRQFQRVSF